METITIPVDLGRIVIIGDPHYDKFRMAKMDPFEGLEALNWGGIDALIIDGDLADAPQIHWLRALDCLGGYVQRGKIFSFRAITTITPMPSAPMMICGRLPPAAVPGWCRSRNCAMVTSGCCAARCGRISRFWATPKLPC